VKHKSIIYILVGLMIICAIPTWAAQTNESALITRVENIEKSLDKIQNGIGKWSFYGQVRIEDFYVKNDDIAGSYDYLKYGTVNGSSFDLISSSRFGADVKHGNYGAKVEFGLDDDANAVSTRYIYAYYDFSKDTRLLIGKDNMPTKANISKQIFNNDIALNQFAPISNNRRTQIKLMSHGFQLALLEQHAKALVPGAPSDGALKEYFPKIEVAYRYENNIIWTQVYCGFQNYQIQTAVKDYNINAYLAGISGGVKIDNIYINAAFITAQNAGQYGFSSLIQGSDKPNDAFIEGGVVKDQHVYGTSMVIGFKPNKRLRLEAGAGYVNKSSERNVAIYHDESFGGYIQAPFTITKGWVVTPEVAYYDFKKDMLGKEQGSMWYAGFNSTIFF